MRPLFLLIAFTLSCLPINAQEASLKKQQVTSIAIIILNSKGYQELRNSYVPQNVTYDKKTGNWSIELSSSAMPIFPGSPIRFFYIRDADCKYRIGAISGSGYSPKSSVHFRMSPFLRKKIVAVKQGLAKKLTK